MNKPWDVIAELEADNSKLAKQAIIRREVELGNENFFRGLHYCYNNLITFGVKKVEAKPAKRASEPEPKGVDPEKFFELCKKLSHREITGDAARVAINYIMNQATQAEWDNWYRRILQKDLKAGFSESTINKAVPIEYQIPVFEAQLAHDGANHEEKVCGKKLIETKLDGVRVITIAYPDGKVDQFSRNGKELLNFEVIKQQISKHTKFFAEPVVLDGEVMSASFQDLMKQVHRKDNVQANDSVLHLFDILTLKEFQAKKGVHRQLDRSYSLLLWYENFKSYMPNVTVVGQELVDLDSTDGQARFTEINRLAIDGGFEGVMLKDPTAVYECKRNVAWLKKKPFIEVTLKAVNVEEGTGKNEGRMGAVLFEGEDDGKFISVSVGGGWSEKQRAQIWADFTGKPATWEKVTDGKVVVITEQPTGTSIIGQFGEIRADATTMAQDSDTYSLRFPRFKTFRGFDLGEKL